MGSMLFAVLAVAAQLDRNYIREKTLEGQRAGAAKGNHVGRPKVIDDDMLLFAQALKDKGTPVPGIARKLVIKSGKNAGQHPSAASLYRAFAEAGEAGTAAVTGDGYPPARVPPASARTANRSPPARRGSASGWSPRAGRSRKGTGHDPGPAGGARQEVPCGGGRLPIAGRVRGPAYGRVGAVRRACLGRRPSLRGHRSRCRPRAGRCRAGGAGDRHLRFCPPPTGIAAGDAIGANVTMLTVVLGLAALARPLVLEGRVRTYALAASAAGVAAALALLGGRVGRLGGALLVVAYLAAVAAVWWRERRLPAFGEAAELEEPEKGSPAPQKDTRAAVLVMAGVAAMAVGGWLAVAGAERIVDSLGLRQSVVGLTFVALATTAELFALVWAAFRRGVEELALAGVLGSAVYNATATLGVAALVHPLHVSGLQSQAWLAAALPAALVVYAVMFNRVGRIGGGLLVAIYGGVPGLHVHSSLNTRSLERATTECQGRRSVKVGQDRVVLPVRAIGVVDSVGCQKSAWPVSCRDAPGSAVGHDDQPCPSVCSI
jgi:cation:H+ antiporter